VASPSISWQLPTSPSVVGPLGEWNQFSWKSPKKTKKKTKKEAAWPVIWPGFKVQTCGWACENLVVSFTAGDDMIWGHCQYIACQLSVQSHAVFPKKTKTRMEWNQFPWMIIYSYDHLLPPPILHLEEDQSPPWLISLCIKPPPRFYPRLANF
jgi:hypothetical protein